MATTRNYTCLADSTHKQFKNMARTVIDDISSDSHDEITRILESKDSKNTKRSTKNHVNIAVVSVVYQK